MVTVDPLILHAHFRIAESHIKNNLERIHLDSKKRRRDEIGSNGTYSLKTTYLYFNYLSLNFDKTNLFFTL